MNRDLLCLFLTGILVVSTGAIAQDNKPSKDATVWAIDDTDKVNPVSGNLLSEGRDVYNGKTPSSKDYRKRNNVWDAATDTVKLFAGRNEFVSFQVILEKGKDDVHKVFVDATDLFGSKARISADSNIHMFKELFVKLNNIWYPDALLPFELAGTTPLELPEPHGAVPDQRVVAVWVDVYVPHNLPPDTYTGQVMVLHRNTNKQALLNVRLEVGNFTLPDEVGLEIDMMNYGYLNIERGFPDVIQDSPRHRAIEREFFRMAHEHRMTFSICPYNHNGSIPKGQKPELEGVGDQIRIKDWKSWDDRYGPLLSGEAFADLPRARQPVGHFLLPYNLMWPSDMRNWKKPEYRTEHLRVSEQFRRHLAEKGWTKTQYQIYYNHQAGYKFFPWNLDEPRRDVDLEVLRYLGEILKSSFPEKEKVQVVLRLDIGDFHCENVPDCPDRPATSTKVESVLGPFVRVWNIMADHYFPNEAATRKLKMQGDTLYFYSGTPTVRENLVNSTFWGWRGYKCQCRDKTPAILPVLPIRGEVNLGGDAVGTLQ